MKLVTLLLGLSVLLLPSFLGASLFLYNPKKELDTLNNPSDPNSTSYQGYRTSNDVQITVLLNATALLNGSESVAILSNAGYRPKSYRLSLDANFGATPWSDMPSTRIMPIPLPADRSNRIIYVEYKMANGDKKEFQLRVTAAPVAPGRREPQTSRGPSRKLTPILDVLLEPVPPERLSHQRRSASLFSRTRFCSASIPEECT